MTPIIVKNGEILRRVSDGTDSILVSTKVEEWEYPKQEGNDLQIFQLFNSQQIDTCLEVE